ncbi:MAG: phosphomannomutase [Candidatus Margulisbacteria bacterium]|jgi:phosphomannomutase|nr:phosphomannomutase [Candidatus Margulisiibacteriota bacterium]
MPNQILAEKTQTLLDESAGILPLDDAERAVLQALAENSQVVPSNIWQLALKLGELQNRARDTAQKNACRNIITYIREAMGGCARTSVKPAAVEFGTSGWRGRIGVDFTVHNAHKVVRAILDTMRSRVFLETNGYQSFAEVQRRGIVIFRDNRYLGAEFMAAAIAELNAAGVRAYDAGECPTGAGSAAVTELKAAGSLNFTPSHNPMDAAGLKFNPADGGPADKGITNIIQARANDYMRAELFKPADGKQQAEKIDPAAIYLNFLSKSQIIDLAGLKQKLLARRGDLTILVDNMHGASRGFIEKILGAELLSNLDITFLHTADDYSFHGVKPEPSAANQKPLIDILKRSAKPLRLAAALDPDADRIRFADANLDIDMNMFAAIALDYAVKRGLTQGVVTSVASSGFAANIARQNNLPAAATAVGFKNFRTALTQGTAAVAFEESDGISFRGHTLEKDGIIGFLVALGAMLDSNANLSQIFAGLQKKYGYYYPGKGGQTITGITVQKWQEFRLKVQKHIQDNYQPGAKIFIGRTAKRITRILLDDGVKFIFEDDSWIMLRASGTETKFRYYYETTGKGNIILLDAYQKTAGDILQKALAAVQNSVFLKPSAP